MIILFVVGISVVLSITTSSLFIKYDVDDDDLSEMVVYSIRAASFGMIWV